MHLPTSVSVAVYVMGFCAPHSVAHTILVFRFVSAMAADNEAGLSEQFKKQLQGILVCTLTGPDWTDGRQSPLIQPTTRSATQPPNQSASLRPG